MKAFRITLSNDESPEKCLGYRSQLNTSQVIAKKYMEKAGAINEVWQPQDEYNFSYVKFFIGEVFWKIHFEEINIEF